jgi:hypothetical protein
MAAAMMRLHKDTRLAVFASRKVFTPPGIPEGFFFESIALPLTFSIFNFSSCLDFCPVFLRQRKNHIIIRNFIFVLALGGYEL